MWTIRVSWQAVRLRQIFGWSQSCLHLAVDCVMVWRKHRVGGKGAGQEPALRRQELLAGPQIANSRTNRVTDLRQDGWVNPFRATSRLVPCDAAARIETSDTWKKTIEKETGEGRNDKSRIEQI